MDDKSLDYKFLDKTTCIYGGPGTGKTTLIRDILYRFNNYIERIFVFCESDKMNNDYGSKLVPKSHVHANVKVDVLNKILQQQEDYMIKFNEVTNIELLSSISALLPAHDIRHKMVSQLMAKKTSVEEEVNMMNDTVIAIYRKAIISGVNNGLFDYQALSPAQMEAIREINLNPRILLVFDDITVGLENIKGNNSLKQIFTRSRHLRISVLMAMHEDTAVGADIRRHAFVSIFTDPKSYSNYMRKSTAAYSPAEKRNYSELSTKIFQSTDPPHQKVVLFSDKKMSNYIAQVREPFRMGPASIWIYDDTCIKLSQDSEKPKTFLDKY